MSKLQPMYAMAFDRHSYAPSFLGNVCLVVGASESGLLVYLDLGLDSIWHFDYP